MPYQFAKENKDYSDYASGRVFYGAPRHPAFPVRLMSELFQRCWAIRQNMGSTEPVVIYDPCCGTAYHLSTLAYLHWHEIDSIIASDVDENVLNVAARNLSLLTQDGLQKRMAEIAVMQQKYGKPSHDEAAVGAQKFSRLLQENRRIHPINTHFFAADATHSLEIAQGLQDKKIDIVIADVPYGKQSKWQSANQVLAGRGSLLNPMLDALISILEEETIVVIITDKAQKCAHEQYKRVGRFQIGKRCVTLLQLAP